MHMYYNFHRMFRSLELIISDGTRFIFNLDLVCVDEICI